MHQTQASVHTTSETTDSVIGDAKTERDAPPGLVGDPDANEKWERLWTAPIDEVLDELNRVEPGSIHLAQTKTNERCQEWLDNQTKPNKKSAKVVQESFINNPAPKDDYEAHILWASEVENPLDDRPSIPKSLEFAMREASKLGSLIRRLRHKRFRYWKRRLPELLKRKEARRKKAPKHVDKVTENINVELWAEMLRSTSNPDTELMNEFGLEGLPGIGKLPCSGVYQEVDDTPELESKTLKKTAPARNRKRLKRKAASPYWRECVEAAEKDERKGRMMERKVSSLKQEELLADRFGVSQGGGSDPSIIIGPTM